jgi:hypothetical protein
MKRIAFAAILALAGCVSTPAIWPPLPDPATHFGPIPPPPSAEELAAAEPLVGRPVWTHQPVGQDFIVAYPRNALNAGRGNGRVVLNCIVQADGSLRCAAEDDGDPAHDFERGALYLSTRFAMAAQDQSGAAVEGRRHRLPIIFCQGIAPPTEQQSSCQSQ